MKRQVVLIHGGNTFDSRADYLKHLKAVRLDLGRLTKKRWKDSFGKALGGGYEVLQPQMPNPSNASYEEWSIWFRKMVPFLKRGTVLVGHSLGGLFLAKYLSSHRMPKKVGATVLLAAPFDRTDGESLGDFMLPTSLAGLRKQGGEIILCYSEDDPVVPLEHALKYLEVLPEAYLRVFKRKQHFNQATFPELAADIKKLF